MTCRYFGAAAPNSEPIARGGFRKTQIRSALPHIRGRRHAIVLLLLITLNTWLKILLSLLRLRNGHLRRATLIQLLRCLLAQRTPPGYLGRDRVQPPLLIGWGGVEHHR